MKDKIEGKLLTFHNGNLVFKNGRDTFRVRLVSPFNIPKKYLSTINGIVIDFSTCQEPTADEEIIRPQIRPQTRPQIKQESLINSEESIGSIKRKFFERSLVCLGHPRIKQIRTRKYRCMLTRCEMKIIKKLLY